MKVFKHKGNGQTMCVGCLSQGKQPIHWDSFIIELQYDTGTKLGCLCYQCFDKANEYLRIGCDDLEKPN